MVRFLGILLTMSQLPDDQMVYDGFATILDLANVPKTNGKSQQPQKNQNVQKSIVVNDENCNPNVPMDITNVGQPRRNPPKKSIDTECNVMSEQIFLYLFNMCQWAKSMLDLIRIYFLFNLCNNVFRST